MQSGESIDGENKNFPNRQKAWLCDDSPFDFVVFGSTIKSMLRPRTGSGTQDLCHTVYIFPTQCQLFIPLIQTTTNNETTDREQCEKEPWLRREGYDYHAEALTSWWETQLYCVFFGGWKLGCEKCSCSLNVFILLHWEGKSSLPGKKQPQLLLRWNFQQIECLCLGREDQSGML